MTRVRIKPGVRPYGGKLVELIYRVARYVMVDVGPWSRPRFEGRLLPDTRMYAADEVEEISPQSH